MKTIEKVIRLCTVLNFFFFSGGCEGRPILRAFFGSKLSIYLQNYAKNGLIFKTTNQRKKFQHSINIIFEIDRTGCKKTLIHLCLEILCL